MTPDEKREIDRRLRAVLTAKTAKNRAGGNPELTPWELDAVLPPVDCAATKRRLVDWNALRAARRRALR